MARDTSGAKNQPQFSSGGVSSQAADLSEVANYAAYNGNRKVDTSTVRGPLAGADLWEGLQFRETDNPSGAYLTYEVVGGSWVLVGVNPTPALRVRANTSPAQSTSSGIGSPNAVLWNVEDDKTIASMHSTSTATSRLVAPVAGRYLLTATLSNATTSFAVGVGFSKNGTPIPGTKTWSAPTGATFGIATSAVVVNLAAGDYVEVVSYGGAASLSLTLPDCSATMTRIGN